MIVASSHQSRSVEATREYHFTLLLLFTTNSRRLLLTFSLLRLGFLLVLFDLELSHLLHDHLTLPLLLSQELSRLGCPILDDLLVLFVLVELQSFDARLNILLLNAEAVEELVVSLQFFDLDQRVDHSRCQFLLAHDHVHLLLSFKFSLFQLSNRL